VAVLLAELRARSAKGNALVFAVGFALFLFLAHRWAEIFDCCAS
jgi:hypothetical protein